MDSIKVFICEDESIVREGLRDMIPWEKYGFEFVGDAPDGEMALPMIRELKPDVLITDITMPFMDGLALSKVVISELPDIKIVIISGYSDFEYARQAIELGVEQYLLKPVT
ncbi:MAG: response regulator, partial [Clostridiales bacterium]|nr:response regulator [Clostridiales bacterium]